MPRMVGVDVQKVVSARTLCEGTCSMQEGSRHGAKLTGESLKSPVLADSAVPNHIVVMAFARSTFWRDEDDESAFRGQFWRKVRHVAASIPFVEDLLTTYYCAFDKATPLPVKASLFGALAYFLLPTDAIPDVLPVLGFTDDAAMLATAVKLMASHIRPEHRAAAKAKLAEFSKG